MTTHTTMLPFSPRRSNGLRTAVTALTAMAALSLAGCGTSTDDNGMPGMGSTSSSTSPSAGATASFNQADVMFTQMMIPHHEQAVAMSDTLLAKSGVDPQVTALAEQIKAAQGPEIATMKGWLGTWGADMGDMGGMGPGTDGMASDAELKTFGAADGPTAQKLYLEMMTRHHGGAIAMAKTEIADGTDPGAVQLARDISTSQAAEIVTMKKLLAG